MFRVRHMDPYFPDVDAQALERLNTLATSVATSKQDLFAEWEAFSIKTGASKPEGAALDAFQEHLQKSPARLKTRPKLRSNALNQNFNRSLGTIDQNSPALELRGVNSVSKFNAQPLAAPSNASSASFMLNTNLQAYASRPFNQQIPDISAELDQEIESVLNKVSSTKGIAKSEITSAHLINQSPVYVVGRLFKAEDDDLTEGNESVVNNPEEVYQSQGRDRSWLLQAPKRLGNGTVPLNFSAVHPEYKRGLFEGAIVALNGKNPKGEEFIANEIIDLPPVPVASVKSLRGDSVLRIGCIAGPQNASNLNTFLARIQEIDAGAAVILGPVSSKIAETKPVLDVLGNYSKRKHIPYVVVPSASDSLTTDPLFPQPPLELGSQSGNSQLGNTVASVSNPCTFCLDEAAFAAVNVGVISDMDITFESACKQILRQQRLYPVYPPPPTTNVDLPKLSLARIDGVAPNVLLLPSSSEGRAAIVDDVLCVSLPHDGFSVLTVNPGARTVSMRTSVENFQFE